MIPKMNTKITYILKRRGITSMTLTRLRRKQTMISIQYRLIGGHAIPSLIPRILANTQLNFFDKDSSSQEIASSV